MSAFCAYDMYPHIWLLFQYSAVKYYAGLCHVATILDKHYPILILEADLSRSMAEELRLERLN